MESNNPPKVKYSFRYWLVPPWGFSLRQEERLYLEYTKRQKQRAVPRLLMIGVLIQAFAIFVPGERDLFFAYSSVIIALFANLTLAALYGCVVRARTIISHAAWLVLWAQLLVSASRRLGDSYNELLGWAVVLQYFTLAALPFQCILLIIYTILSFTAYLLIQYYNALSSESRLPEDFVYQQLANGAILIAATLLGGTAFAINENQQRRAFQETKRSLRDKLTIEQQSKEQERLLLSVLPEHVAVEMRQDLGLIDTQFKKIYMSRHENVSILYADIVGFTAISSTYSAQDLVAILNELFARFDRLAEKYQQLRIKILGDCYYCISGAPVERPDHAVLCVHMGLSMVKAIKYVQQTTNSPVDMRVGIHTGAVLAGVLGQRQWQFDVYSRDVELANKMESSGMAGRVHVSEVTLSFLKDEFEVEPAYGEKREEMLRQAGIKTYFISKVLKPWGGEDKSGPEGEGGDDALSDLRDDDEDSVLSPEGEKEDNEETKIHNMLVEELVNRDDDKELAEGTNLCLMFKSADAEECYVKRSDPCPTGVLLPPLFLLPPVLVLAAFALPLSLTSHLSYAAFVVETGLSCIVFYVTYRLTQAKQKYVNPKRRAQFNMFNLGAFASASFLPLFVCGDYENKLQDGLRDDAIQHSGARRCIHPSYYYHKASRLLQHNGVHFLMFSVYLDNLSIALVINEAFVMTSRASWSCAWIMVINKLAVYTLCCVLWVAPSTCSQRIVLLVLLTAVHAIPVLQFPVLLQPRASLDKDPYMHHNFTMEYEPEIVDVLAQIHRGRHYLMLTLIAIGIMVFDRYLESLDRARHSRGERMRQQAEQAGEIRRRNQALVYNVLPPHVARHFMGAHRHHRDLYSQSYAEVGVLFASMPNFTEFYSEETVNNQGLECLRFLNEVISDFDLLLEDPKFSRDIIKIKTISSTYMAASGLNPTRQMQPSDGTLVRWAHLDNLVEFALELQRVLAAINEQSFNHFVLRMGVNHGPITAGVIGARKPHYDIWGNTVNVASRMESTGKAGCIQVTEETCHILEEFGYYFEQRGLVAVKGKGQLMTYYLQGKQERGTAHKTQSGHTEDVRTADLACEAGSSDALLANGGAPSGDKLDDPGPDKPLLP